MKNILESEKVFGAYAQIDYCYYSIQKLSGKINKPLSPIEVMVDVATLNNSTKEDTECVISLLKTIIKCKKIIDADYSGDKKALDELIKLKKAK